MFDKKVLIAGITVSFFCISTTLFAQSISSSRTANGADSADQAPAPTLEQRYPRYVVQREDVMDLTFPIVPEFNQTVTVQPDGYIPLLNAGSLHIQGMTVPQIEEAIKKAYANTLNDPVVTVTLREFQKPFFVVSGQVGKPGRYTFRDDMTVFEAIGVAGGLMSTAKQDLILYHRVSSGWLEVKKISLKDMLHGKNVNEDSVMHAGDMIFVPENFVTRFKKYVPYSAGIYLNPSSALF